MQMPSAVTLSAAAPRSDAAAEFEEFYAGQRERVFRALAVTLRDPTLAAEATDEAMARGYARWAQLRTHANPGGWLYRVGLNWATSWWRKVRRERPLPESEPAADSADPTALALLDTLPLAQRSVVVCRVLLQLSTAETAAALSLSEGTVKSRLSRALSHLRAALHDEEGTR
ncbi:RNA polymerase sigma factor [Catellatospora tritici]|uniref:RNA polymerase sigma factor n=1 Tax=Catellatospora tritici TaxID=2851566 RepID=UPI001C2D1D38|nr:RNA polymerase sigma factor [Catellatospora tritici]MBV1848805.1 RNA polymerase sigma factor [Catellatospora tritici]